MIFYRGIIFFSKAYIFLNENNSIFLWNDFCFRWEIYITLFKHILNIKYFVRLKWFNSTHAFLAYCHNFNILFRVQFIDRSCKFWVKLEKNVLVSI